MMEKVSHDRVKTLLKDTITLLCKNGIEFRKKFSIEALIGITVDDEKVVLMSINELVRCNEDDRGGGDDETSADSDASSQIPPTGTKNRYKRRRRRRHRSYRSNDDVDDIIDIKKFRDDCEPYVVIKSEQGDVVSVDNENNDWSYQSSNPQHHIVETSADGTPYLVTKSGEDTATSSWLQPPPDNPGDPHKAPRGLGQGPSTANKEKQYQKRYPESHHPGDTGHTKTAEPGNQQSTVVQVTAAIAPTRKKYKEEDMDQAIQQKSQSSDQYAEKVLKPFSRPLAELNIGTLRAVVTRIVRQSPHITSRRFWGVPGYRPVWWPSDMSWSSLRAGYSVRDLRRLITLCYEHHNKPLHLKQE